MALRCAYGSTNVVYLGVLKQELTDIEVVAGVGAKLQRSME